MGRQVQVHGRKVPLKEMIASIEKLTPEDIQRVAETVFTGKVKNNSASTGKPTIVMQGYREAFGDVEACLGQYGLGNLSPPSQGPINFSKSSRWI